MKFSPGPITNPDYERSLRFFFDKFISAHEPILFGHKFKKNKDFASHMADAARYTNIGSQTGRFSQSKRPRTFTCKFCGTINPHAKTICINRACQKILI